MSRSEGMEALCIEGTELLLLEMPFCPWSRRALREVWELQARTGLRVMLAHVERYLRWQTAETWDMLEGWGVLNQCTPICVIPDFSQTLSPVENTLPQWKGG